MKMLKKFLLALLACTFVVVMAIGVTACGGGNGEDSAKDSSVVESVDSSSEGLEYELSEDGTYYTVTGKGTCTDTDLVIPSTYNNLPVTTIGFYAFIGCSLTSVEIGDNVTTIGDWAFSHCSSLTSVEIGDNVTTIGEYAFLYCESLTSVVIGENVTTIGEEAFSSCYSLTSVVIGDNVATICDDVFLFCISLTNIQVDEKNTTYKDLDGNLYTKDGATLIQYAIGKTETTFTVPDSVTTISKSAFAYCDTLTSVVIGENVTTICDGAFSSCYSLTDIQVNENNINYKDIDGNLYTKDGTTLIQYAIGKTETTFTIPVSVTTIGDYVFSSCYSLTSVVIGDNVTTIGDSAFYLCNALTEVYYKGTASDWNAIEIDYSNYDLTYATRYYYSETQPTTSGKYWHYVNGVPTKW